MKVNEYRGWLALLQDLPWDFTQSFVMIVRPSYYCKYSNELLSSDQNM